MDIIRELERILKAVANRRRLAIVQLLHKKGELNVTAIAEAINLSFTSTSKHLRILDAVDIVEKRQQSLEVYYRLAKNQHPLINKLLGVW